MYVVAYETSSLIYHAKPVCYVCNRCLFSLSPEIKMAEKQNFYDDTWLSMREPVGVGVFPKTDLQGGSARKGPFLRMGTDLMYRKVGKTGI